MASIAERITSDGSITFRVQIRKKGQPPICKTFKTKNEAEKFIEIHEIDISKEFPIMYLPLSIYIDRYLDEHCKEKKMKNTYLYEKWKDYLGNEIAPKINSAQIEKALVLFSLNLTHKKMKPSPETIRKFCCALSAIYTRAIKEWKWCEINPVTNVSRDFKQNRKAYRNVDVPEETIRFKILLRNKIEESLPGKSTREQRLTLGMQKTSFNYMFDAKHGTTLNSVLSVLKRIGLTLDIIPLKDC